MTDSSDVEIAFGTTFTLTLSSTYKAAVNLLLNKTGTASDDATTYNLAAAEDWAAGVTEEVAAAALHNRYDGHATGRHRRHRHFGRRAFPARRSQFVIQRL